MGAQSEARCHKTSSVAGARGIARPRATHAPEIPTPTPAINLRFNIDGLTKGLEGVGGLLVGEVEEEPE